MGYTRVATADQHPEYQVRALERRGCERIFTDQRPARFRTRPQLASALAFLHMGDTLAVWKFDRLAHSVPRLLERAIDTGSPGGRLAFTIFGSIAQFESDLDSVRTKEAAEAARSLGVHPATLRRWFPGDASDMFLGNRNGSQHS